MQTGMPTLPLCLQNSSSLHMSCFKPKRAGKQEGRVQLTSPLLLLLLSVMPSWGNTRLLHHVSKQSRHQDALAPFLASTSPPLVLCLMAAGRLWLGLGVRRACRMGWEMKLPTKKHFTLPSCFQPQSSKPFKNRHV